MKYFTDEDIFWIKAVDQEVSVGGTGKYVDEAMLGKILPEGSYHFWLSQDKDQSQGCQVDTKVSGYLVEITW